MYQAKMSKEALLVVLNEKPDDNLKNMDITANNFLNVHSELLLGRVDETTGKQVIDRTTNICMLNQMDLVLQRFTALRQLCKNIADAGSRATMDDLLNLDQSIPVAFGTMNTA